MKILDIIIEKGKGTIIRKLQTIQLIKADSQLLIRIFIGNRMQGLIEKDNRISKSNYRLWKFYSIETALLEKRLIYDSVILSNKVYVHNIKDL